MNQNVSALWTNCCDPFEVYQSFTPLRRYILNVFVKHVMTWVIQLFIKFFPMYLLRTCLILYCKYLLSVLSISLFRFILIICIRVTCSETKGTLFSFICGCVHLLLTLNSEKPLDSLVFIACMVMFLVKVW